MLAYRSERNVRELDNCSADLIRTLLRKPVPGTGDDKRLPNMRRKLWHRFYDLRHARNLQPGVALPCDEQRRFVNL